MKSNCSAAADRDFGPGVDVNCRSFDFTLDFEDIVFACLPAAVFLTCLPLYLRQLLRRRARTALRSKVVILKLVALGSIFALQLTLLVLRSQQQSLRSPAWVAAATLELLAVIAVALVSALAYQRSLRPPSVVTLYLSIYLLLSTARARTFWLIGADHHVPAITMLVLLMFTAIAITIEFVQSPAEQHRGKLDYAPEQYSTFWNRAIFAWLAATFRSGYSKVISLSDVPALDPRLKTEATHVQLLQTLHRVDPKHRGLMRACFTSYAVSFSSAIIPRLALSGFTFAQPFLLNATVTYVGQTNSDRSYTGGLIGAWALVMAGIALSRSIYQYQAFRFVTRVRGGLTALVYQRSLHVNRVEQGGKVTSVAILGADIPQIVVGMQRVHELWASVVDIGIAAWLLERQLSLACLAPIFLVLVFFAITARVSSQSNVRQRRWIEHIQKRLKLTRSFLEDAKGIKMLGLTHTFRDLIQNLREEEVVASASYRRVLLQVILLSTTPTTLAPILTFAAYVLIARYWQHTTLDVATGFTALNLVGLLTAPVMLFTQIFPQFRQTFGCFDRVQEYCKITEISSDGNESGKKDITKAERELDMVRASSGEPIYVCGKAFKRKSDGPAVLNNIDLCFAPGTLTAVVGPVGCGKSSLLESVLGELVKEPVSSKKEHSRSIAYCAQVPWLENKTMRENIIGQSHFDDKWYTTVVVACDLEHDIESLPRRDMTKVGSKGVGLSGGQKHRVALARAVYARKEVVLLDDIFSSMDAKTAMKVSRRLLYPGGLLRAPGTIVVLATTSRTIISIVDDVVVLEGGTVAEYGPLPHLLRSNGYVSKLGLESHAESVDADWQDEKDEKDEKRFAHKVQEMAVSSTDVLRRQGDFSVYKFYLVNSGFALVLGYFLFVTMSAVVSGYSTIWLNIWSEANERSPNENIGFYIGIYVMLGIIGAICACLAVWLLLVRMVSVSSSRLHMHLLNAVLRAPFWFLTSTDAGELINRFSQDMELIDMGIPTTLAYYISSSMQCFVKLIILFIYSRYLGTIIPVFGIVVYLIQRFYLRTSRQVRLLGIEAKAPLYSQFLDSTDTQGAVTIRAFCWQSRYLETLYSLTDTFQQPEYLQVCIQNWLTFVLDFVVAILTVILAVTVIYAKDQFDAGDVGVSFIMVIGFSMTLMGVIQAWTQMETNIGAVTRVKRFAHETPGENTNDGFDHSDRVLPDGQLRIDNLTASYKPGEGDVLKDISMSVNQGQHVAICGRSGSGKTSLILSLLQMLENRSGSIKIGDVDSSVLSRESVRGALSVVTQDPIMLPGTIRFNCDPFGCCTDEQIHRALSRVRLLPLVEKQGGLDGDMDVSTWSVGERQLLCLVRAMIKKRNILVLDELASSVDHETESVMQEVIDSEFRCSIVLAIMHKLDHVMRYDKVAIMADGKLVEFDDPKVLITQESRFKELLRD